MLLASGAGGIVQRVKSTGMDLLLLSNKHRDAITVVLMVGDNEESVEEVVEMVLATTVGPYELVGELQDCASELERASRRVRESELGVNMDRVKGR